jgi:glycosyltransferase involved in cell wall biosynthesis
VLIMLDSDLQHPPELIPTMLDKFEEGFDVVQTVRSATANQRRRDRVLSHSFYRILNFVSDTEIVEGGADFRLLSRRVVDVFQTKVRERNQFLRGLIPWMGFPTATVEFVADERIAGETSYSLKRSVRLATDGLVSLSKTPLRFGTLAGLTLAGLSALYTLTVFVVWLATRELPDGWVNLAAVVVACTGLVLVFLAMLGWYIGAILDEVKARPHYIVAERISSPDGP